MSAKKGSQVIGKPRTIYKKGQYWAAKRAVAAFGGQVMDHRRSEIKALSGWAQEIVESLGGRENVSPQEMTLIEMLAFEKFLLDGLREAVLLKLANVSENMPRCLSLTNKNWRAIGLIEDTGKQADRVARLLGQLGLQRRARRVPSLNEYLESKYGAQDAPEGKGKANTSPDDETPCQADAADGA